MKFSLNHAIEVLSRTPSTLKSLLMDLSEPWVMNNEGAETWSAFDIVGHLIHGERTDWIPRVKRILEQGESRPFVPFDRFAQVRESRGKTLDELLETFTTLREHNLQTLKEMQLSEEHLALKGKHPDFGTVTLRQLLATWVVHDLNHIFQTVRVMANQYGNEVGPWAKYLSILKGKNTR
jgi:uncharacterized damage-inducible protein DinB